MLNKLWLNSLLIILFSSALAAQTNSERIISLQTLYEDFKFEEVISGGRNLLKGSDALLKSDIRMIHEYMAIAFFNIGETDSSYRHFTTLLVMDHEHALDPIRTSPKILDFYSDIKDEFNRLNNQKRLEYVNRYIFVEDLRPGAAWRSALLPGWGQFYKDQQEKGFILGGAFFTGLIITAGALVKENDYKDKYLNSDHPSAIPDLYNQYNSWSKIRRGAMYTTIVIWLINFSDALWSDYPQLSIKRPDPDALSLSFSFTF